MKFCIFGFNDKPKVAKARKNLASDPMSFDQSCIDYNSIINSGKYNYIYFIVDLGNAKDIPFYKAVAMEIYSYTMIPWLLISKYEKDKNEFNPIISGAILKLKGFTEEFKDMFNTIERYMMYLDKGIKCELYCDFVGCVMDKRIYVTDTNIDTKKIRKNLNVYCNKYKLE